MTGPAGPDGPAKRVTPSLRQTPRLGDWITITADGRVLARSGKVELGQGITTALAQIVAEELDVDLRRVTLEPTQTGSSPDEGLTSGSMSVQHSGDALREVCARVRAIYLAEASEELGRRPDELTVVDGEIRADYGGFVSYWSLADDTLLDVAIDDAPAAPVKDPGDYRHVGRSAPRVDGAGKIFGQPSYIHDLRLPGQLFGRVVRPPARVARLRSVDDAAVRAMSGVVDVVRDGSVLAVIADDEAVAVAACRRLAAACDWEVTDSLPDQSALSDYLMSAPSVAETVYQREQAADAAAVRTITRRFSRGFVEHASLAPSCGVAVWDDNGLRVWSHSQGIYRLRSELAREFGVPEDRVVVTHAEGAGCYGHNAADDAAFDAALLARRVPGSPVHVVWSRQDEHTWEPFGPAMVTEIQVSVDASAAVTQWRQDVWSNGHVSRPSSDGLPPLLSAQYRAEPLPPVAAVEPPFRTGGGMSRNAVPLYDFPAVTAVAHRLTEMPLRTSALRALGAHLNVYAIESVIDELAEEAGRDPIAYRLDLLADERARAVLEAVADRSRWHQPLAGENLGRGVGFARYKNAGGYCAVVAEVEAEAELRVRKLTVAVDVGLIVNPDGVLNQIEGGAIQAASWTTLEQVRFDRAQVTSQDWESYPILRFEQVPGVDVVLLSRPDMPTLGSGEMAAGPTAAAIGNALANAIGVRVPTLPLTPDNIVAAMA